MRIRALFISLFLALWLPALSCAEGAPPTSRGRCDDDTPSCCRENGGRGWCGKRRGDRYGASKPVRTRDEAAELLRQYYADRDGTITNVTERRWCYQADLVDKNGRIVDRVMIDRRSGRIRSIQ